MDGTGWVAAGMAAFVGTHFLLSHPLRAPLVRRLGEGGFLAGYSLVAVATLGLAAWGWRRAPAAAPWWPVGDGLWAVATLLMLAASVLLLGSLVRNPALPGAGGAATARATGVYAVTRHPMMWSFALWAGCHLLVWPVPANAWVTGGVALLALGGAAGQDRRKARLDPAGWPAWEARTSFWPFAALLAGRARLSGPGIHALAGGTLLWLVATWAHWPLAGWRAGVWRWLAG